MKDKELPEPEGGFKGRITVKIYREVPWAIIKIQDNGIGMTKEQLDRLFVPFFTTKATSTKGTGLGLFVIWEIIKHHKGTIQVESEYGRGSTFTIRLPLRLQEGEEN
ncbi:MAG: ATP-binding protein [Candidatus Omnitrophica bacterium]|nr:ATP-binding protein [Candidatus Omnitrophota bacterium]